MSGGPRPDYMGVFGTPPDSVRPSTTTTTPDYSGVYDPRPTQVKTQVTAESGWDYLTNLTTRGWKMSKIAAGQADPADPETQQMMKAMALDPIQGQKMMDFGSVFGGIAHDVGGQIGNAVRQIKEQGVSMKDLPAFTGNFAKGLIKPFGDIAELTSGISITDDDIHQLTPEEKFSRVKNVAGTAVMLAMGKVASVGIGALGADELATAIKAGTATRGQLAMKMLANSAVGGVAGASYGAVTGLGEDDMLTQMLANGVFGGTLAGAHDILFGKKIGQFLNGPKNAGEIAQTRQLQSPGNSMKDVMQTAASMSHAGSAAEALMYGTAKPAGLTMIHGVDSGTLTGLATNAPEGFSVTHWLDKDGTTGSALLVPDALSNTFDRRFFAETGMLKDQIVNLENNGSEYRVVDGSTRSMKLQNILDPLDAPVVDRTSIRQPSKLRFFTADVAEQGNALFDEWRKGIEAAPRMSAEDQSKMQVLEGIAGGATDSNMRDQAMQQIEVLKKQYADQPSGNILERQHDGILEDMNKFLDTKNVSPDEKTGLLRNFQSRLLDESLSSLPLEERQVIEEAQKQRAVDTRTADQKVKDFNDLMRQAKSNGLYVTDGGSGRVIIRDLQTKRIISGAENINEARRMINATGQADGPDLDQTGSVDPAVAGAGGGMPPTAGVEYPQDQPYNWFGRAKNAVKGAMSEDFIRGLDNVAIITRYRDYMLNIDRKYGTKFGERIFDPVTQKRNMRNAMVKPWAEQFGKIQRGAKLAGDALRQVGTYMQTMTPDEVANNYMARPMNLFERETAQNLAKSGTDIERVFRYRREVDALNREFPEEDRIADPQKAAQYQSELQRAQGAYQMDGAHLQTAQMFDQIEAMNMKDASLGAIVRLARAINNGAGATEMSKGEFAATNKLTLQQMGAASNLRSMYQQLAKVFGISPERQLDGFMTHAKLYTDGDLAQAVKHFSGDVKTRDFYAALARTGEISAYEENPYKAMMRYLKAGFDQHSGFNEAIRNGNVAMTEELRKLPRGLQEQAQNVIQRFTNDVQGFPEAGDRAAEEAVHYMMDKYKLGDDISVRRGWVNAASSVINAGALGLRPMLGIGHFGISTIMSLAGRDFEYTRRMLAAGGKAIMNEDTMNELHERGVFQGLSPFAQMRADDFAPGAATKLGNAVDVAQNAMFKATLLPTVYDGMAAGHYLTASGDALDALTKFNRSESISTGPRFSWDDLRKQTHLDRFDAPVQETFKKMAATNVADAAHYLGTQAVEDMVGTYGNGAHPYKWGTNFGRIAGQFGNFSMWIRSSVQRMASRGTVAQRMGSIAKLTALSYGVGKAGDALGIDLNRMNPFHAMTWMFGPLVHTAMDASAAVHGSGYEQEAARRRLMKMLPVDANGNFQPSIFVPGSFAVEGMVHAADSFSRGQTAAAAAQAIGFKATTQTPSM